MKIFFSLLIVALLWFPSISRAQREMNRIVIWDVTESMIGVTRLNDPPDYGYNPEHDIFGAVKKGIIDVINKAAADNSGTIRILQFRERVLDNQLFKNTPQGRAQAVKFVSDYKLYRGPRSAGNTNICGAWEQSMQYLNPEERNVIYLFTDGGQNVPNGPYGVECLSHLINTYCALTQNSDAFTFFVTLDVKNNPLAVELENACPKRLAYVSLNQLKKTGIPPLVNMRAMFDTLYFNIQDNQPSSTERYEVIGSALPSDFAVHAALHLFSGSYPLDVSEKVEPVNGRKCDIDFALEDVSNRGFADLRNELNGKLYGELRVDNATSSNSYILISPATIPVVIFDKKPETLNFRVK